MVCERAYFLSFPSLFSCFLHLIYFLYFIYLFIYLFFFFLPCDTFDINYEIALVTWEINKVKKKNVQEDLIHTRIRGFEEISFQLCLSCLFSYLFVYFRWFFLSFFLPSFLPSFLPFSIMCYVTDRYLPARRLTVYRGAKISALNIFVILTPTALNTMILCRVWNKRKRKKKRKKDR